MSFMTDMALEELEEKFAAVVGLLVMKEILTMDEYETTVAEVKRIREEEAARILRREPKHDQ